MLSKEDDKNDNFFEHTHTHEVFSQHDMSLLHKPHTHSKNIKSTIKIYGIYSTTTKKRHGLIKVDQNLGPAIARWPRELLVTVIRRKKKRESEIMKFDRKKGHIKFIVRSRLLLRHLKFCL